MSGSSRRRRSVAFAVVGAVVAAAVAGCGGSSKDEAADPLTWTAAPQVFTTKALPADRVAVGMVRNTTGKPVTLDAADLVVRDAGGKRLRSTGQYAAGYAHGLYGAFQKPDPIPPGELARLGRVVTIPPGKSAPLAVSWSIPAGSDRTKPSTVDYGPGTLELPLTVRMGVGV